MWEEQLAAEENTIRLTNMSKMSSHEHLRHRLSGSHEQVAGWLSGRSNSGLSRSQSGMAAEKQFLIICVREECGGHVRLLQQKLAESLQCEVVIGTDQVDIWRNEVARASKGVVLLQTKNVLRDPIRLLQLFEATRKCHPLVCVNVVGGGYDFEAAGPLLRSLRTPSAAQLPDADMKTLSKELSQLGRCNVAQLSSRLGHAVPNAISVFFNPEAGDTMFAAVVKDVLHKLEREAELTRSQKGVDRNLESVFLEKSLVVFHAQRVKSQLNLVRANSLAKSELKLAAEALAEAATEEEPSRESMPEEAAPRRRKGSKTSMGMSCQVVPEVEGGQQSDLVPPRPRSRKGSKSKMAMHRAETVGLVEPTSEMVEMGDDREGNVFEGSEGQSWALPASASFV